MTKFVPVNKVEHAGKGWRKPKNYSYAAKEALVPIVGLEVAIAAVNMPLAFVKHEQNTQLVGVLGPQVDFNMFVADDGKWLGAYIPGILRSFPFRLAQVQGRAEMALCVESDYLNNPDTPIYDDAGELARPVAEIVNFLNMYEASRQRTAFSANALEEAGVLTPWPIKVRSPDGREAPALTGLLRVDEAALNALDEAAFLKLRKIGALPIAYGQMLSISRLELLARLGALRGQLTKAAAPKEKELNLDFLREDDGNLVF